MVRETQRFEHRKRRSVVDVGGEVVSPTMRFSTKKRDNDICPICTLEIFDDINSNTPLCIKHNNQYLQYPLKGVKKKSRQRVLGRFHAPSRCLGKRSFVGVLVVVVSCLEDHPIK